MPDVKLEVEQIQGNVVPGFRTDLQAVIALRFAAAGPARRWLGELARSVTSARDVRTGRIRRGAWVNVGLSSAGLERLEAPGRQDLPVEFRAGMFGRAAVLGDRATGTWKLGGSPDTEADAVVIIGANGRADLEAEIARQLAALDENGIRELATYRGERLPGALHSHEHFGFRDGISQPVLAADGAEGANVQPGEFILGYPDETGAADFAGPSWARNGSYLVFRRIRQHVDRFRRAVAREAPRTGLTPPHLAAKLVGRWPRGAKLGAEATEPKTVEDERLHLERADFAQDPAGERIPLCAHVRKVHPRDVDAAEPQRHRLLRRGIPYGKPLAEDAHQDDGEDRGLLFLAYQASIARQFEHVQRAWMDDPAFPPHGSGPTPGPDALVGQPAGDRTVSIPRAGGNVSARLEQFVSVTGGGYFLAPSIEALIELAGPGTGRQPEETKMPDAHAYLRLGEFIHTQNPYPWQMELPVDLAAPANPEDVEKDGIGRNRDAGHPFEVPDVWGDRDRIMQGLFWYFDGKPRRVSKAVRIEYTYTFEGKEYTEHLLIGFEGAGGGQ